MRKEGYIEINYRIAVIMNESGLLRNTYSNIVPNLLKVMEEEETVASHFRNRYQFYSFTRNNISTLFDENSANYILNYDAVFVGTNATNDREVLSILTDNKDVLERFINKGKGFFLGSQKRLSDTENVVVPFLPEAISFTYKTRVEEKSSEGAIAILDESSDLVQNCDIKEINRICHNNRFKDHVYRSHIVPLYSELFDSILVDEQFPRRNLLVKVKNQKVVYSTVSLDYEEQNSLLKNIILYITAGMSTVAFFSNTADSEFSFGDKFNNILLDAKLNKLPLTIYNALQITPAVLDNNIYVVSSAFHFSEVKEFWKKVQDSSPVNDSNLKKLIYINDSASTENILTEFRNYNETDVQLRYVIQWLCSTIENKANKKISTRKDSPINDETSGGKDEWGLSFWETYDTMSFMFELANAYGEKYLNLIQSYAHAFFSSSLSHYRGEKQEEAGSYDGMLNCSCALLELFFLFDLDAASHGNPQFEKYDIKYTMAYIKEYLNNDRYMADNEIVLLSLCNIKRYIALSKNTTSTHYNIEDISDYIEYLIKQIVRTLVDVYHESMEDGKFSDAFLGDYDLIEISKDIEVIGYALGEYRNLFTEETINTITDLLFRRLLQLKNEQSNGCWVNAVRTGAILKSLIRTVCISDILSTGGATVGSVLSQIIISALNYLSNEINREQTDKHRVWMKDLMATVTIGYSLCLYNSQQRSVATEIEKSIFDSADNITSVQVIDNSAVELTKMRNTISTVEEEKRMILEKNEQIKRRTLFPVIMSMVLSIVGIIAISIWIANTPEMNRGLEVFLEIVFVPLVINIITNIVMTLNNYDIIKIKRKAKTKKQKHIKRNRTAK